MRDPTAKKIEGFAALGEGWHYGEGEAFSSGAIEGALRILAHLRGIGFTATDAFPGTRGQIAVTVYHEPVYIELIVERDGVLGEVDTEEYHPLPATP